MLEELSLYSPSQQKITNTNDDPDNKSSKNEKGHFKN